jgi:hypothetical protein
LEESGVGDRGAIGIANYSVAVGGECGYGESHGDAVVAVRFNLRTVQFAGAPTFDAETIGALFDFSAEALEIFDERGNAVAFFYAQFGSITNLNSLLGVRAECGEHGKFVDE